MNQAYLFFQVVAKRYEKGAIAPDLEPHFLVVGSGLAALDEAAPETANVEPSLSAAERALKHGAI